MNSTRRIPLLAAGVLTAALTLTACGGSGGGGGGATGKQCTAAGDATTALAKAKKAFDDAPSVHLSLSTSTEPSGSAILAAEGVLTHQPGFKGSAKVKVPIFGSVESPVIAVDGKVYAKIPGPSYAEIKPADFNAPDPASFADPDTGLSSLLLDLAPTGGCTVKRIDGDLLAVFTGTLTGAQVAKIIPSANTSSSYTATIGINDAGQVAHLSTTGDFFSESAPATYDVTLGDYDKTATISAP
ncbi:MAG: hypothetical protein JWQ74_1065 [Marmoricola sp.]|nr:hypothetical protein [Marmoricola sp.]